MASIQPRDSDIKQLCLNLIHADSEAQVVSLLTEAGYWDHPELWRYYGDNANNYSVIGNQQSRPDAALVEKLVNSVDARLINECLVAGVDPESITTAPSSIREAIARFFETNSNPKSDLAGRISEWLDQKRRDVARGITLAATGAGAREGSPCYTISDCGEGQTPDLMPKTFLSLTKGESNKVRIPFVQGKFNMGGTGVLKFCGGRYRFQLIVSRRNPVLLKGSTNSSDDQWGFTIVRREDPSDGSRSSTYTYLAPLDASSRPHQGGVLRFTADELPIFPDKEQAYARKSAWGTLIKLYEYSSSKAYSNSHILMKDGLFSRIDLLLPEVGLPIRFHECRKKYTEDKGHKGSFDTTLTGIGVRLSDDRQENIEPGFPSASRINVQNEAIGVKIYAFKRGKADAYKKSEGIIFTVNGQTHGHITTDFFRRGKVGMSYLRDSILVILDCSGLTTRAREDLFMNSRDRLSAGALRTEIEDALEDLIKQHEGLRQLANRRREEDIASKLENDKPLEDILESLLRNSPTLASLFLKGSRLSNPFTTRVTKTTKTVFVGLQYPTYFRFKGKPDGTELSRDCHLNMRARIAFETDAESDYFGRKADPGRFVLYQRRGEKLEPYSGYVGPTLYDGTGNLTITLPTDCNVGDVLEFVVEVCDDSQVKPFVNKFCLNIKPEAQTKSGTGTRTKPQKPGEEEEQQIQGGIALPQIYKVREPEWSQHSFDKFTALVIKNAGGLVESENNEENAEVFDFYVNMDNICLKTEQKAQSGEPELLEARFVYGLVLLGLGLIQDDRTRRRQKDSEEEGNGERPEQNIEDKVSGFTRGIAPVLLPMISSLGSSEFEVESLAETSGEAT